MNNDYRYPWPASALGPSEMAMLHNVRESSQPRTPITKLLAKAVRDAYGATTLAPATTDSHKT